MELHKIEDVDFSFSQNEDMEDHINLVWKEGTLYISMKNLVLTDGRKWYDLPINELENVHVVSENPTRLRFELPSLDVIVTGKYAERLLALRHFLLPFLHPKREKLMKDNLKTLLKFWALGVKNVIALTTLLPLTAEETRKLLVTAREDDLIADDGSLTEKGLKMFSDKERELLESLEVING
ncbi:MAG: hypothetical protein JSV09_10320 [Thermoplasmata archaeon]|nr:MAG: hypothetical protein JSV09_10320 [Thermoplasmata archaeon]